MQKGLAHFGVNRDVQTGLGALMTFNFCHFYALESAGIVLL